MWPPRPRGAVRLIAVMLGTGVAVAAGEPALASALPAAAPPPLSAAALHPDIASSAGSGSFGRWLVDAFGLPVYRYDIDEQTAPRAHQPEDAGSTAAQHELGNDHIKGAAFNDGYTQFWSQDRLAQWANKYRPGVRHFAGGYGYLNVGGQVLSTLYLDRPSGARFERRFGVGYYERRVRTATVGVREDVYAPFGDDPLLRHDVTITNRTAHTLPLAWFEYWDVDPFDQTIRSPRGLGVPAWNAATRTLSVAQTPSDGDTHPLSIFAAALSGPVGGYETSVPAFFGSGTRARPAAVAADRLGGGIAPAASAGRGGSTLFAFRAPITLRAGQSVTLRYAYGMATPAAIGSLVTRSGRAPAPFTASERAWAAWLPKASFGPGTPAVSRELEWDGYLLRGASVYEQVCGYHTITQGGYYQYSSGLDLGSRSWLHYLLPIVQSDPVLAREILRYSITLQSAATGGIPYGTGPLCSLFNVFGTSDDLDFWLLLAAAEYGLGTRDVAFFSTRLPFYGHHASATVWQHIKLSFRHQESLRGPLGGYLAGTNGDWSDFSAPFLHMTESMLVPAQLAYAYPRLAALAEMLGDRGFAAQLRARARQLVGVLRGEWTGRWYLRGYSGAKTKPIGRGAIFGEPQPWAILAGAPSARQAAILVANIRRFLTGIGAPAALGGPARIGSALSPALHDPGMTDPPTAPGATFNGSSQYVGGVWFDPNGWLTWSLLSLDGVVPGAVRDAWSEYTRNTLAAHATAYPNSWDGTISIDDACNAFSASHPDRCGIPLYNDYSGQITEQPTWMVMGALHFAGITPTETGFDVDPHLAAIWVRFSDVGVQRTARFVRGYVRVARTGRLVMSVGGFPATAHSLRAWVGGRPVHARRAGARVRFTLPAAAGRAAAWAVTWS